MAKKTETETPDDTTTFKAMKKSDFEDCKARSLSANNKIAEARGALGKYLQTAKDEKSLHLAAFRIAMTILKKEEPARGELLFHLGHYLRWGGALDQPDLLREEEDDERDLRPRHLREAEKQVGDAADAHREGRPGDEPVH